MLEQIHTRTGEYPDEALVDGSFVSKAESEKTIYKERAAIAECVNAIARNRGLRQLAVRGLEKAKTVLLSQFASKNYGL